MADVIIEFRDIFGSEDNLGEFPKSVRIPTRGKPRAVRVRQIALAKQELVDNYVAEMLRTGVIEECPDSKGWNSSIILVTKKDGSWRPCMNFRPTLNLALVDEEVWSQYSTEENFKEIKPGNKYFSSVDLLKGY